jgi:VanZ family protein
VAIGVCIIVLESTELFGSNHTNSSLRWLWEALFGPVGSAAKWQHIHQVIRKCGHFFGYGFIGVAWLRAWWMTLPNSHFLEDAFLALMGTSLIASVDELHQSYLPNRTGSGWDVLLDCCGALSLQLILYIYLRLAQPKSLARAD